MIGPVLAIVAVLAETHTVSPFPWKLADREDGAITYRKTRCMTTQLKSLDVTQVMSLRPKGSAALIVADIVLV